MNKNAAFVITGILVFVILIAFFSSRLSTTKNKTISNSTNVQVSDLLNNDPYDGKAKIGVSLHPADNNLLLITGNLKSVGTENIEIATEKGDYNLSIPYDVKVLVIDDRLDAKSQLDRLYTQAVSELQIGEKISANVKINKDNHLEVVSLQKNIRL